MNLSVLKKNYLAVLSIVALVGCFFSIMPSFTYYYNYDLTFTFTFQAFLFAIIRLSPLVLLVLFVFKLNKSKRACVILPIVFALTAIAPLYSIIQNLIRGTTSDAVNTLLTIITIIPFAIVAFKGTANKKLLIATSSIMLFAELILLISYIPNFGTYEKYGLEFWLICYLCGIVGRSALYVTLMLFGLKNNVPGIVTAIRNPYAPIAPAVAPTTEPEAEPAQVECETSPADALRALNEQQEQGMLSEEEYRTKRAEIISRL